MLVLQVSVTICWTRKTQGAHPAIKSQSAQIHSFPIATFASEPTSGYGDGVYCHYFYLVGRLIASFHFWLFKPVKFLCFSNKSLHITSIFFLISPLGRTFLHTDLPSGSASAIGCMPFRLRIHSVVSFLGRNYISGHLRRINILFLIFGSEQKH